MVFRTIVAGAAAGPGGVVVRGFFRTRLVPWPAIVEIGPSNLGGSSCVALRLDSGEIVRVRGCAAYSARKLREYAEAMSGARPAGFPTLERQAVSRRGAQSGVERAVRRRWFLVGLPLLAVPLGLVFVAAFSYWPGVALSIGGAAIATMNYRRLKSHRSRN
jgi:Flp pilus assembly protein TadB